MDMVKWIHLLKRYLLTITIAFALLMVGHPTHAWAENSALETITVQLKWMHQFQFAGYYEAKEQGFYRDVGLDVQFIEGSPEYSPIEILLAGRAMYAIADSGVLLARAKGKPVVVLANIFQYSPSILMVLADSNINKITDLQGKRIMLEQFPLNPELRIMLKLIGGPFTEQANSFNIDDLIAGRIDAFSSYATNEPFLMQQRGIAFKIFDPVNYGIPLYGDMLITTEAELHQHPERAAAFRKATIKGWKYAMHHVEESVELIKTKYDAQHKSRAFLMFEASTIHTLMPDIAPIGYSSIDRWQQVASFFVDHGLMSNTIEWDQFLYQPKPNYIIFFRHYSWELLVAVIGLLLMLMLAYNLQLRRHVTARTRALAQVTKSAEEKGEALHAVIHHAMAAIIQINAQGVIYLFNPAAERMFGYDAKEVIGHNIKMLMPEPYASQHDAYLAHYMKSGEAHIIGSEREMSALRKDGTTFPIALYVNSMPHHNEPHFIGMIQDITERKQADKIIQELAYFDSLTKLPNRQMFMDRITQAFIHEQRNNQGFSLLFLDLDGFKKVNDTLGHKAGDAVLKQVAQRLRDCVREGDTVARLGGDEFTVILANTVQKQGIVITANKIIDAINAPINIDTHTPHIGVSIGIAIYPADGDEVDTIIQHADRAMYTAKKAGKNRAVFY